VRPAPSAESALLERIEELSFLRTLNDGLARAPDFASACRTLVELVWEERHADAVAFVVVDGPRRVGRFEAIVPSLLDVEPAPEINLDAAPLSIALAATEPVIVRGAPALPVMRIEPRSEDGVVIVAPFTVRGATRGVLLVESHGDDEALEDHRRLLALVATSAALALEASRSDAREEFLATLRHDINNPVHVALGYTEMLVDRLRVEGCPPEMLTLAGSVAESLKAVADLVSNHLHMAVIDRGVAGLSHASFDFGAMVAEIVDRHRLAAAERRITLAHAAVSALTCGDRRQLGRVVTNLVGNALKYTPSGGQIAVEVLATADDLTFRVRDTGYGVQPADLGRLFTKYARFHRDKAIPGTGLGLYLSKTIVEAHGGSVWVESVPEQGSVFTVQLPRLAA
jgi:signal transduction histidine kinase